MMDSESLSTRFIATILRDGAMCAIPIPFDLKPLFGKARPPVVATLNGYSFRTTPAIMNGERFVPLRMSNRVAAGLEGGETLEVTLTLDEAPRSVAPPDDLAEALRAADAWIGWGLFSFTHQKEYVEAIEDAKRPETRARRVALAVAASLKRGG